MNKSIVLLTMLMLTASAVPLMAKEFNVPNGVNITSIEDNLLFGLSTNNTGVQRSCALLLGKIQSDKAVVPLMALFSNYSDENLRIAAAWALCMIGDRRGINAVKAAAKNDECSRVQAICRLYYENLKKGGKFSLAQPEENINN